MNILITIVMDKTNYRCMVQLSNSPYVGELGHYPPHDHDLTIL